MLHTIDRYCSKIRSELDFFPNNFTCSNGKPVQIDDVQPELSIIGTSPDSVQSLDFFLSRLISGFCLDQIKTRFESGLDLEKIKISVLKLITLKNRKFKSKILNNRKIQKNREFEFEKIEI